LLNLELMVEIVAFKGSRALSRELDRGVSQIHRVRQLERSVESAQRIDRQRAVSDLVVARVLDSVADILDGSVKRLYVAGLARPDSPNPDLEMNLFARLIHPAVIKDVPPQPVFCIFLAPARLLLRPPIDILGKDRDVGSFSSDEQAPSLARIGSESDSTEAVG